MTRPATESFQFRLAVAERREEGYPKRSAKRAARAALHPNRHTNNRLPHGRARGGRST